MLAYPKHGLLSLIQKNSRLSAMLHAFMFISILVALGMSIFFSIRAAKREMCLCAALVKQMNATQQAERKSMFKTQSYLRANHDIRSALAAITTLLDLCHDDTNPNSELAANLAQTKTCTKDLLGELLAYINISSSNFAYFCQFSRSFNLVNLQTIH